MPAVGHLLPPSALNRGGLDNVLGQVRSLQHFADSFLDKVDVNDHHGTILHFGGVEADRLYVGGDKSGWDAGPC